MNIVLSRDEVDRIVVRHLLLTGKIGNVPAQTCWEWKRGEQPTITIKQS